MFSKTIPVMESMETRRLLTMVWEQGFTNMVEGDGTFSSYHMWFTKQQLTAFFTPDPSKWMQDYSWLGEGFEPVTFNGQPAVKYVGSVAYVVDPAAMKKWSVEEFLAEYPHAFDQFPKDVLPKLDFFMVETDAETGVKTLKAADFMFNYGPDEGQHGAIAEWGGGTLNGGENSKPVDGETQPAPKVKHKKRGHRHHKAPARKEAPLLFMDRRLTAVRG